MKAKITKLAKDNWWVLMVLALMAYAVLVSAGCGANLVKPETLRQRIAYTEGGLTAAYQTIRDLRMANKISVEGRNELVEDADKVGAGIGATKAFLDAGQTANATTQLEQTRDALLMLQGVLEKLNR